VLRRCLLIGTAQGADYVGKQELTGELVEVLKQAIALNRDRIASEILYETIQAKHAFQNIFVR
jgi:60 kDa SS-A/Ro ribonucleoprotein